MLRYKKYLKCSKTKKSGESGTNFPLFVFTEILNSYK